MPGSLSLDEKPGNDSARSNLEGKRVSPLPISGFRPKMAKSGTENSFCCQIFLHLGLIFGLNYVVERQMLTENQI